MKIGITGIEGSIALKLADRLRKKGHDIVGCDIKADGRNGDFTRREVAEALAKKSDVCVHSGAVADLNRARDNPLNAVKTNTYGTGVVVDACARHEVPIVYISTCCVYGDVVVPAVEELAPHPTELYAQTKLAGEEIVRGYSQEFDLTYLILRWGTTYGPGLRGELASNLFLKRAKKDEKIKIHGDGRQTRNFIYVDDLIEGTLVALKYFKGISMGDLVITPDYLNDETLNLAGPEPVSVNELALRCIKLCDSSSKIEFTEDRRGQIHRQEIDNSKAEKYLDWTPSVTIGEGLEKTLEWLS